MITRRSAFALLLILYVALGVIGCSSDDGSDITNPPSEVRATCVDCHTDEAMLKATVAEDEEPPEDTGEG